MIIHILSYLQKRCHSDLPESLFISIEKKKGILSVFSGNMHKKGDSTDRMDFFKSLLE